MRAVSRAALILALAAFAALLAGSQSSAPAAAGTPGDIIQGDADCSGTVATPDLLAVLQAGAGVATSAGCVPQAGNLNCNGGIDLDDVIRLARHLAGAPLAASGGCADIGSPIGGGASGPTSGDLIEDALEAGDIDEEAALTYQVFAAFSDPRLPPAYKGAPGEPRSATGILLDVIQQFDSLSEPTQDALYPFLLPALQEGSWYDLKTNPAAQAARPAATLPSSIKWQPNPGKHDSQLSATGKYRVWWLKDHPASSDQALLMLQWLDGGDYQALVDLMGREPLLDNGDLGVDAAIDIVYYEDQDTSGTLGQTLPYAWLNPANKCKPTGTVIGINGFFQDIDNGILALQQTITHEMFHSIQFAFDFADCAKIKWVLEGSAKWVEDYRWPNSNKQQYPWNQQFTHPYDALNDPQNGREYSRYVFFLFLARTFGAEVIREGFENMESVESLVAWDQAIPGGFNEVWPEYAVALWNQPTNNPLFQWDGIPHHAKSRSTFGAPNVFNQPIFAFLENGAEEADITMNAFATSVLPMTAYYWHVRLEVTGTGETPDYIRVNNGLFGHLTPELEVQIAYRLSGQANWVLEDFGAEKDKAWCRTKPDENVAELVVIMSNADETMSLISDEWPTLAHMEKTCPSWTGNASVQRMDVCAVDCHVEEDCQQCVYTINFNGQASDLSFEATDAPAAAGDDEYFILKGGKIAWSVSGNPGKNCTASGGNTVDIPEGKGILRVSPDGDGVKYALYGYTEVTFQYTVNCGTPQTVNRQVGIWLCSGGENSSATPDVLNDSYFFQGQGGGAPSCDVDGQPNAVPAGLSSNQRTYSWNLTR